MTTDHFEIDIACPQKSVRIDTNAIKSAIMNTLAEERVASAVLSVTIVDNALIHKLNRDQLQHDYPTDVISFQLDFVQRDAAEGSPAEHDHQFADPNTQLRATGAHIEGEIVASAEMAAQTAAEHGWSVQTELTLYVLHGLLHVCGYDDLTPDEASLMRRREQAALRACGLSPNPA